MLKELYIANLVLRHCQQRRACVQIAEHHSVSVAQAQMATEYWKQQAEQSERLAGEVRRGVAGVLAEQRHAAQHDLRTSLKSKAQELTEKFGREIGEELKEQYHKLAQVRASFCLKCLFYMAGGAIRASVVVFCAILDCALGISLLLPIRVQKIYMAGCWGRLS